MPISVILNKLSQCNSAQPVKNVYLRTNVIKDCAYSGAINYVKINAY